jgi:Uncharacterized conserved protein
MGITEELGWSAQGVRTQMAETDLSNAALSHASEGSSAHCAYNQTRECFLALDVLATELSYINIGQILATRSFKSGEGIWLRPFHGIPTKGLFAPLDLIYLDAQFRVLEVVESFPTFQASTVIARPASVLVLPAHSIYSSQTQAGDQLILCVAEEMETRLEQLASGGEDPGVLQGAVVLREHPLWSGGPGVVELESRALTIVSGKQMQAHEMSLIEPGIRAVRPPQNWLQRWWSPDPRRAPRERAPGVAAYYWNGAAPKAHAVRDISATGLYVLTEERWYPGTLVLMTLHNSQAGEQLTERSISVLSRAVRWGNDGVGLQFVLDDDTNPQAQDGKGSQLEGVNKEELAKFLQDLLTGQ